MPINVAIVEDDDGVRESLAILINGTTGFRCAGSYRDAETALKEIPSAQPDVVLMDINLPKMTGVECVQKLKQLAPKFQTVMLTAYEDDDQIFHALQAGAGGYLSKRSSPGEILEAIAEAHGGGAPMSSNIARKVIRSFHRQGAVMGEIEELTRRETEILNLLAKGFLYKEIAALLSIGFETVHSHTRTIYEKLHVRSRTEAVTKFLRP